MMTVTEYIRCNAGMFDDHVVLDERTNTAHVIREHSDGELVEMFAPSAQDRYDALVSAAVG